MIDAHSLSIENFSFSILWRLGRCRPKGSLRGRYRSGPTSNSSPLPSKTSVPSVTSCSHLNRSPNSPEALVKRHGHEYTAAMTTGTARDLPHDLLLPTLLFA